MEATDEERQAVWESLLLRSTRGVLQRGDIVEAAALTHISRFTVARIWERGISSMPNRVAAVVKSRKSARGRKKLDRAALCKRVAEVPVDDRENQRCVQAESTVGSYLVQRLLKEGYLRRALRQTRPLLSPAHQLSRLKYCVEHVKQARDRDHFFDPMYDMYKDKLTNAGTLPISLPCDTQTLVSAHFDMARLSAQDTLSPPAQPPLVPPLHDENFHPRPLS